MATSGRGAAGRFATGNIFGSSSLGFAVGNPEFLSSADSKVLAYWRNLEHGTSIFEGRVFYGVFGAGFRTGYAGTPFTAVGDGAGQQFIPLGAAASFLSNRGKSPTSIVQNYLRTVGESRKIQMVIKKPIVGQEAYGEAFRDFGAPQRELDAVAQVLGSTGFTKGGFQSRGGGKVVGSQTFVTFESLRKGRREPSAASSATFVGRVGFVAGARLSPYTGSLVNFDRTFQREMTEINRLLAQALASEIALLQKSKTLRPDSSSGRLIDATLSSKNRFPS